MSTGQWRNICHDLPGAGGERITVLDGVGQAAQCDESQPERAWICADEIDRVDLWRRRIGDGDDDVVGANDRAVVASDAELINAIGRERGGGEWRIGIAENRIAGPAEF